MPIVLVDVQREGNRCDEVMFNNPRFLLFNPRNLGIR